MSRELTIAWAKRNCPDPRVAKDVALRLDEAAATDGHLILIVGKRLTRSRSAYLLASRPREMFAFELTARQSRHLGAEPTSLGALVHRMPVSAKGAVPEDPVILLTDLQIANADRHPAKAPVTGHFTYQSSMPWLESVAVRMMFDLPGGGTHYHYDHLMGPLPGCGTLRFALTPLVNDMNEKTREIQKTLPVFISLCRVTPEPTPSDVQISNTCAALIDLV